MDDGRLSVAMDGKYVGNIRVADELKQSTPDALRDLKSQHLRVVMLTGDGKPIAAKSPMMATTTNNSMRVNPGKKRTARQGASFGSERM